MPTNQARFDTIMAQIQTNQSLPTGGTIPLTSCGITDTDCQVLANALYNYTKIVTVIELHENSISSIGVIALVAVLESNPNIQTNIRSITLSSNTITASGATALANFLKINSSLQSLWFSNNLIGDEGATALAQALKVNKALQTLSIPRNGISDSGAIAIAAGLQINTKLYSLSLGVDTGNPITNVGYQAIAAAMQCNYVITTLTQNTTNIYQTQINNYLSRNQQCGGKTTPYLQCPTLLYKPAIVPQNNITPLDPNTLQIMTPMQSNGNNYINPRIPLNGTYTINAVQHGQFVNSLQQPITQFSQAAVNASQVFIQTDNSGLPFSCNITASYGDFSTCLIPLIFNITNSLSTSTSTPSTSTTMPTSTTPTTTASTITTISPTTVTLTTSTTETITLSTTTPSTLTTQTTSSVTTQALAPSTSVTLTTTPATTITITSSTASTIMLSSSSTLTSTTISTTTPATVITSTSTGSMNSFTTSATPTTSTPFTTSATTSRPFTTTHLPTTQSITNPSSFPTTTSLPSTSRPTTSAVAANLGTSSSSNIGAILGGVAGGIAAFGATVFALNRYRRKQSAQIGALPTNTIEMASNPLYAIPLEQQKWDPAVTLRRDAHLSPEKWDPDMYITGQQPVTTTLRRDAKVVPAERERLDSQSYQMTDQPHLQGHYEQFAFQNSARPAAAAVTPHTWNSQTYVTDEQAATATLRRDPHLSPKNWNPDMYITDERSATLRRDVQAAPAAWEPNMYVTGSPTLVRTQTKWDPTKYGTAQHAPRVDIFAPYETADDDFA